MPDFTFRQYGAFVALYPETPEAERAWNDSIAPKTDGTGKVLAHHWPEVERQLKAAGYTVRQSTPAPA